MIPVRTSRSSFSLGSSQSFLPKSPFRGLVLFAAIPLLGAGSLLAQGLARVSGTITDSTGAVIPGATVTVTQVGTGSKTEVKSNDQGDYVFPTLPPATYDLSVASTGFAGYVQKGVLLQADASVSQNVVLKTGSSSETVEVTSDALQVDTSSGTLSQVINTASINELPLNGRNAAALTTLVAGVVIAPNQGADQGSQKSFPGVVTISANGTRANQTNYMLDGGNNVDEYTNVNAPFPMPDSIQEFSVQTSNYNAEYGQNAGGVVNVITKSGTNQFHGGVFEYVRNAVFNGANYFGYSRPIPSAPLSKIRDPLKRNQFGGTIGGPILHDKLFGFFGYQKTIQRTASNSATSAILPTPQQLAGNFSNPIFNPATCPANATTASAAAGCTQYANNHIDPSTFNASSLALLKYLPTADSTGTVLYKKPVATDFNEYTAKVDWNISHRDRASVRYFLDKFAQKPVLDLTNLLTYADGSTIQYHNALISETHTFSDKLLNNFIISYQLDDSTRGPSTGSINMADLGVNIFQPTFKAIQSISIANGFSVGDNPNATFNRANYTLGDDLRWTLGRHSISVGFHGETSKVDVVNQAGQPGSFGFSSATTGDTMASFLLGYLSSFSQASGQFINNRNKFYGAYAQDSWKLSKKLTFNYGVRYEPALPWHEKFHRIGTFDPAAEAANRVSSVFPNAPAGLLFPGDAGVPVDGYTSSLKNFSPRLGFAYDVFGDGRTAIRGGSGMFFDTRQDGVINNAFSNVQPFVTSLALSYTPGNYNGQTSGDFSHPYTGSALATANPFPATQPPPANTPFNVNNWISFKPNGYFPVPTTYVWNLALEQQLSKGLAARIAYVGSHGSHNFESIDLNPTYNSITNAGAGGLASNVGKRVYAAAAPTAYTASKYTSQISQTDMGGNTHYNSLQATLEQRVNHGLSFLFNYTWSHATDDLPYNTGVTSAGAGNSYVLPVYEPNYKRLDHGASDFDHRNVLTLSYVWKFPAMHEGPAFARAFVNGWQSTGLIQHRSGDALTILSGAGFSNDSLGRDRAVYNGTNPYGRTACATNSATPCRGWLLGSAFATTPKANAAGLNPDNVYGNVIKGAFTGPGYTAWDAAIHRYFTITERVNLQFRAEFFNVLNHTNFGDPNVTQNSASFGQITGTTSNNGFTADPRIGQLSLKLAF